MTNSRKSKKKSLHKTRKTFVKRGGFNWNPSGISKESIQRGTLPSLNKKRDEIFK